MPLESIGKKLWNGKVMSSKVFQPDTTQNMSLNCIVAVFYCDTASFFLQFSLILMPQEGRVHGVKPLELLVQLTKVVNDAC